MNLPHVELLLLAQTAPAASPSATTAPADAAMIPLLALKRWFGSATLASPIGTPSKVAVWAWLTGLGGLLVMAILAQGPAKAFAQLLDLGGLMRLVSAGIGRLKRSGRLVAILLAATVVSWTAWQTPLHNVQEKKEDLALLLKSKSRAEFAGEQGTLAALTPLRDLLDMGDNLILLVATATLVFKFSADRWGRYVCPDGQRTGGRPVQPAARP